MSTELDRFRLFQRELQREAFVEVRCPRSMPLTEFTKLWNAVGLGLASNPETLRTKMVISEFDPVENTEKKL